jgi:hypothetical protein
MSTLYKQGKAVFYSFRKHNQANLTRTGLIKNNQLKLGGVPLLSIIRYNGILNGNSLFNLCRKRKNRALSILDETQKLLMVKGECSRVMERSHYRSFNADVFTA